MLSIMYLWMTIPTRYLQICCDNSPLRRVGRAY